MRLQKLNTTPLKVMLWQPRIDKTGPLLWNNATFQCVLQIPKIYGVPYDWVWLREGRHYRYYINTEMINRSGETFYTRLQQQQGATLAIIRRHKLLLRNLRVVHKILLRANTNKLNRQHLNILFNKTLSAHIPANGFILFGSIFDTWSNRLENILREKFSTSQAKRILILLLTSNKKNSSFKLSKQARLIANIIREVGQAMFKLREQIEKNREKFAPVLDNIRQRMKISPTDWEYVSWKQIAGFLKSGIPPSEDEVRANKGINIFAIINSEEIALHGQEAKQWFAKFITKKTISPARILRGTNASNGKASGRIRVVRGSNDFHKFRAGEVLVTFITTPPYVPIMSKAAAIITEVGGITSHAAVVSRELGKPCIIGVRDATRLLKTGELVEIDADHGIITKQK